MNDNLIACTLTVAFYSGTHSPQIGVTEDGVFKTYQHFLEKLRENQTDE
ncbi:MAG: hypothetical protein AABO57_26960 [Acidobacteriota bacterium]